MNPRNFNLIPRKRRAARRLRSCIRAWCMFGVAYVIVVAGACGLVVAVTQAHDDPLQREASGLVAQIATSKERLSQTRAELAGITRRLAASREVQGHPDWSILLRLIAANRGEGLALASFELGAVNANSGGNADAAASRGDRPSSYSLRLNGLGKDHTEVAQFALRLEQAGIFSRVVLKDTVAKQLASRTAVSFGIECTLSDVPGLAGAEK